MVVPPKSDVRRMPQQNAQQPILVIADFFLHAICLGINMGLCKRAPVRSPTYMLLADHPFVAPPPTHKTIVKIHVPDPRTFGLTCDGKSSVRKTSD